MEHIYIGLLCFLSIILYGAYIVVKIKSKKTLLEEVVNLEEEAIKENLKKFRLARINISSLQKLVLTARQAGLNVGEVEILLGMFISSVITFLILTTLFSTPYVGWIGIVLGAYLPFSILKDRIRKRGDILSKQLHGSLIMWSNSIRSGATLSQAISASISRVKPEIREELKLIKYDIDLGSPAADALEKAQERIPVTEFKMVCMTARIHKQLGGNLAERFENIATTIEDRIATRNNLKAYTTQARLGSTVAGLMPFGVLAGLRVMSPDYLKPMIETELGKFLLMLSVVLVFLGWISIKKMGETQAN